MTQLARPGVPASAPGTTRSAAIDGVRVIGVVAVVVGHAVPDDSFRALVFAWHVPLFFILSGYFFTPGRTLRTEAASRWQSLGRPYVFWLAIIAVLVAIAGGLSGASSGRIRHQLSGALAGGANGHEPFTTFWFVSALFASALLFRVVMSLCARVGSLAPAVIAASLGLLAGYLVGPALAHTPLAIGSALPCLTFLLAGRLLRPVVEWIAARRRRALPLGIALVVAAESLVGLGVIRPVDIKAGDFGTPGAAVLAALAVAVGLLLVAGVLVPRLPAAVGSALTTLSRASLCAVLVHPVVQWATRPLDLPLAVDVALMLVLPWALGLLSRGLPVAGWATGVDRARPRP